jgi:hypothetical protein
MLRHALGFLMIIGLLAPSLPVFAVAQGPDYDQVFRFIEATKGKTTAKRYTAMIVTSAQKHDLPPLLVANLILSESSFNPKAISPMGAIGLMQVMPFHYTKRRIPISQWHDPALNIDLGCQIYASYVAMMDKRYPGLAPAALQHRALVAYNMGPRAVVSRGIYRSRYSQKISQGGMLVASAPQPSRPVSVPPPPEAKPLDTTPIPWEQLPLATSRLDLGLGEERPDGLRVGYPLPETVFLRPADGSSAALPLGEAGTP